jgi:hypothetical protein
MKKIPTIFVRDPHNPARVTSQPNDECLWVFNGEGLATVKWDGTACLVRDGRLFKRYDCKKGRTPPALFEPCSEPDPVTGHWPGWVPVGDGPEDMWFREPPIPTEEGTYELVGPKINGNPYKFSVHRFMQHGNLACYFQEVSYDSVQWYLCGAEIEGLVWHHEDGRMAKIKRRDFSLPWPP